MIRYLTFLITEEHIVKVFSHFDDRVFYRLKHILNELPIERGCREVCFFNECKDVNGDPTAYALLQCASLGGLLKESCFHLLQPLLKYSL